MIEFCVHLNARIYIKLVDVFIDVFGFCYWKGHILYCAGIPDDEGKFPTY